MENTGGSNEVHQLIPGAKNWFLVVWDFEAAFVLKLLLGFHKRGIVVTPNGIHHFYRANSTLYHSIS